MNTETLVIRKLDSAVSMLIDARVKIRKIAKRDPTLALRIAKQYDDAIAALTREVEFDFDEDGERIDSEEKLADWEESINA